MTKAPAWERRRGNASSVWRGADAAPRLVSVAAVDQAPARSPGGRNDTAHVAAAAIAVAVDRSADEDARAIERTVPASTVPASMPTAAVPMSRGCGRGE